MDLHKLGIKFFVSDPGAISLPEFIPVFQSWIQKQAIPEHQLVDVHDYSHIPGGPGILLVAHEGNFSIDMGDERPGLLYYRKHPSTPPERHFAKVIRAALQGCALLEGEPALSPKIRFMTNEAVIVANDRMAAPNTPAAFSELEPVLRQSLHPVFGADLKLMKISGNPKERLTIRLEAKNAQSLKTLVTLVR